MALNVDSRNYNTTVQTPSTATASSGDFQEELAQQTSLEQKLEAFYEVHQRSQITGVAKSKYDQALRDLGLDPSDNFAGLEAIELLQKNGYDTSKPSDEAVLKYGAKEQEHGNRSYMKSDVASPKNSAIEAEIASLNEQTDGFYAGAKNYYDTAHKRASATKEQLAMLQAAQTPQKNDLQASLKEQLQILAKEDKDFLSDLLKDLG